MYRDRAVSCRGISRCASAVVQGIDVDVGSGGFMVDRGPDILVDSDGLVGSPYKAAPEEDDEEHNAIV